MLTDAELDAIREDVKLHDRIRDHGRDEPFASALRDDVVKLLAEIDGIRARTEDDLRTGSGRFPNGV